MNKKLENQSVAPFKLKKNLETSGKLTFIGSLAACLLFSLKEDSQAYQLLPVQKDTSLRKNSIFVRGSSSFLKVNGSKSVAYLDFPLPSGSINSAAKFNVVLQTRGIRGARNLRAFEITGNWNERSLVLPKQLGPARSNPVPMPKKGLLKFDVTELVKAQINAGRTNISLALGTDKGGLQVMARESGLGAQLEVYNINSSGGNTIINNINTTNIIDNGDSIDITANVNITSNITVNGSLNLGGFNINKLIKLNVSITPPPILGGLLWSTNIVGLTQPGDIVLSVNGLGLTDNLLPSININPQGELQIGLKNLNLLNILNPPQQDLTLCILR